MTGVITSTAKKQTLITILQDIEYIHGQLFERSVESACGSVTCLPGALTILRFSAFRKMAKYYFADKAEQCDDLFDYGKCHLGEDRWLTHLFMIGAKERYQIQMCMGAFCKTEAVTSYRSLLKQRRRWFLGFITNEVCMLTDVRLWRRYPILCVVRFMQNTIRTTALLFFIMVLSLITTTQKVSQLPVGFIAVSLGLNWALMFYFGIRLKRFKAWLYPIMFILNPFFNWVYMVYGIFTAGQRTWGGPRADAGTADDTKTPQQAIEEAEAKGDDLQVVPETFRPAMEQQAANSQLRHRAPVHPDENVEGRFTASNRLPGGYYNYSNDSMGTLPDIVPRNPNAPRVPLHPRASFDSFVSGTSTSAGNSVYFPRRVESIMGEEDRRKYLVAQSNQREAGGAYMVEPRKEEYDADNDVYGYKNTVNESTDSIDTIGSAGYGYHARSGTNQQQNYSQPMSGSTSPTTANAPANTQEAAGHLSIPEPVHRPQSNAANNRGSTAARSPLARLSLVRTAGADGSDQQAVEMTPTPGSPSVPPSDAADDDREGRSKERKKLSKNRSPK